MKPTSISSILRSLSSSFCSCSSMSDAVSVLMRRDSSSSSTFNAVNQQWTARTSARHLGSGSGHIQTRLGCLAHLVGKQACAVLSATYMHWEALTQTITNLTPTALRSRHGEFRWGWVTVSPVALALVHGRLLLFMG